MGIIERIIKRSPDPDFPSRDEELAAMLNQPAHKKAKDKPYDADEIAAQQQSNQRQEAAHRAGTPKGKGRRK